MLAHSKRGVRRSEKYVAWLREAGWEAKLQARGGMIVGEYDLTVKAVRPDKRKRDLDNLLKPISDLIVGAGLVEDDSLCRRIVAEWAPTGSPLQVIISSARGDG